MGKIIEITPDLRIEELDIIKQELKNGTRLNAIVISETKGEQGDIVVDYLGIMPCNAVVGIIEQAKMITLQEVWEE